MVRCFFLNILKSLFFILFLFFKKPNLTTIIILIVPSIIIGALFSLFDFFKYLYKKLTYEKQDKENSQGNTK